MCIKLIYYSKIYFIIYVFLISFSSRLAIYLHQLIVIMFLCPCHFFTLKLLTLLIQLSIVWYFISALSLKWKFSYVCIFLSNKYKEFKMVLCEARGKMKLLS